MFDTILGLPLHPLVIHAVVVLAPLSAALLLAYAFVPKWRVGLRWPTLGLSVIAAVCAFVAVQSGEEFKKRVGDPQFDHQEKGEMAAISCYVLAVAAIVIVLFLVRAVPSTGSGQRSTGGSSPIEPVEIKNSGAALAIAGKVLAVGAAAFLLFAVLTAGHTGAESVWKIVGEMTPTGG